MARLTSWTRTPQTQKWRVRSDGVGRRPEFLPKVQRGCPVPIRLGAEAEYNKDYSLEAALCFDEVERQKAEGYTESVSLKIARLAEKGSQCVWLF